jgi:hypothetical protein
MIRAIISPADNPLGRDIQTTIIRVGKCRAVVGHCILADVSTDRSFVYLHLHPVDLNDHVRGNVLVEEASRHAAATGVSTLECRGICSGPRAVKVPGPVCSHISEADVRVTH